MGCVDHGGYWQLAFEHSLIFALSQAKLAYIYGAQVSSNEGELMLRGRERVLCGRE